MPLVLEPRRSSICPRLAYFSLFFLFLFFFSSFLRVERGGRRREKDMLIVDAIIISRYRSVGTRSRKSIGTSVWSKDNWSSDKLISAASFSDGGLVRCHRTPWSSSRCIAIVPYEDEKKKGAAPVSFRHPCDLIVYSTALFFLLSSLFRPRSLSVIFFFFPERTTTDKAIGRGGGTISTLVASQPVEIRFAESSP